MEAAACVPIVLNTGFNQNDKWFAYPRTPSTVAANQDGRPRPG
jgi:hypothetical protein